MAFAFTDEQAMIAETVQGFFADNATSARTRAAMEGEGIDRELWQSFCQELGLGGVLFPEEFGGAGLGHVELAIIAEAAGYHVASIPLHGLVLAGQAVAAGGTQAQKEHWLPKLASGEVISTGAGCADLACEDDGLCGTFPFVPHGGVADLFLLAEKDRTWLVERGAEGLDVHSYTTMDQTRPQAKVTLNCVKGDEIPDWESAIHSANVAGFLCLAAEALGGAQACLDKTVAYAQEREQFGRPIGSFQAYKHRLADMMVLIEQARSAVYWAACSNDEGVEDPALALHAAKAYCADAYFKCASDMIQLHGGIGFTWEHDAHLYFKRARSIQTMMMDGNWHREQIATMILGEAA